MVVQESEKFIDPDPNPAKNTTVQLISRAVIDFHLWTKQHGFALILNEDGNHRFQELHE